MSFVLLLAFLFMLYASPALLAPALEVMRPAQIAGVGALGLLVMERTARRETWRIVWPESHLLAVLLAAGALSSIGAFWPRLAVETTLDLAKIALVFFLVVNCINTVRQIQWAFGALVVGGIVPATGTIVNYVQGDFVEGTRASWLGAFANPNDLAYSLVVLLPMAFLLSRHSSWFVRPLFWAVLALFTAAILATQSRGGMLGLFAVISLLGLRHRYFSTRILAAVILAVAVVFAAFYWTRDAGFSGLADDFTVYQRMESIRTGLRMFMEHPFLGVGLGCSVVAWPLFVSSDVAFRGALMIHNTPVQALSEVGLVGFSALALLFASGIVHARRLSRKAAGGRNDSFGEYATVLEVSLWGYIACGLSGGYLVTWVPYIVLGFISALICLSGREQLSNTNASKQGW